MFAFHSFNGVTDHLLFAKRFNILKDRKSQTNETSSDADFGIIYKRRDSNSWDYPSQAVPPKPIHLYLLSD